MKNNLNALFKPDWGTVEIKDGDIYAWRTRCKKKRAGFISRQQDRYYTVDHSLADLYMAVNWWLTRFGFPIVWPEDQVK